jgi:hypothetical protein
MATIPRTQLAGVFRVRNKPEKFPALRSRAFDRRNRRRRVPYSWNIHPAIPFDTHERTGNDQINRTIGIRDLSDDVDAPRGYFLNPLPK